ncbi:serine/threonine-protein kinase [Nannocystis bainbridge]|uniref:Serine/threonine-protein kinase n=1 Tax=Nannocystis bainbridge TaxID=2995303 RepID=A0ABT5E846_9BACT|nr:serine/threonine-protein kinase [Nannocystis bainbridge]MDC0721083.1 serine/threonine-protein kinase [Nannocystis bainbridge]
MVRDDDSPGSRVSVGSDTMVADTLEHSASAASTPSPTLAELDDRSGTVGLASPPPGLGDPLGKDLMRRALFPRRAQPVRIGRYTVLKLLGEGGMGVVYACFDDQLDRKIAVKILHLARVRDPELSRVRLLREAQAMARLSHPNIITAFEVGQAGEQVYVAMEFIRGATLDAWTAQPRSWREVVAAFVQAGRGLEAAHRAGLVHRDFKPQNVMIDEDGRVKVLDFGLARGQDSAEDEAEPLPPSPGALLQRPLTRTGVMLGTPAYMPPEQRAGLPATAASDQFSFCVALYQCLYGGLPFATDNFGVRIEDVLDGRVIPPPPRSPVPARVFKALRRGLTAAPAGRFGSMTELLAALQRDPAALYRRVGALLGTAAVAGAVGIYFAGGSALAPCPDARAELAGIWDEDRAQAVRDAIAATGSPRAGEVLGLVEPELERYADAWSRMRNDACIDHALGRQSAHMFDLRTSCLDQRRAGLAATVEALATAEASRLAELRAAVGHLPPLDACADITVLTAAIAPPADPLLRVRVQRHREALARAQVYEHTGQQDRGLQIVGDVLADVEAAGFEPLLAEAHLRRGSLEMQGGDSAAAERSFDAALWAALATGHGPVAAQTSSRRGFLRAVRLERPAQALADLPLITALNRRVQHDVELYSEYLNYAGTIHATAGDWAEALRLSEQAVALRERHGRLATPQGIGMLFNVGLMHREEGRYEQAQPILARAIALSDEILGRQQAERTLFEVVLALNLQSLGRPRAALEVLRPLLRNLGVVASKEYRKLALAVAGMIALADGDAAAARRDLEAARQTSPEHFNFLYWLELMRAAAATGDPAAMQSASDAALALVTRPLDLHDFNYQDFLLAHGRALGSLGRAGAAVQALERVKEALAEATAPRDLRRRAAVALELGKLRARLDAPADAERELLAAREDLDRVLPPRNLEHAEVRLALGELALQQRQFAAALTWLKQAESIYEAVAEPDYTPLAQARFASARALTGDAAAAPTAAREAARRALAALRARSRDAAAEAVTAWLAEHGE